MEKMMRGKLHSITYMKGEESEKKADRINEATGI